MSGIVACSGVPNPFDYYPGLSFDECAQIDPASANAMRDSWAEHHRPYQAEVPRFRLVDPTTHEVVIDVEQVDVATLSDEFQSGEVRVEYLLGATPEVLLEQEKRLIAQLDHSSWACQKRPVTDLRLKSRFDTEIVCMSPPASPKAKLMLSVGPKQWALVIGAPWTERCKRIPPQFRWGICELPDYY